MPGSWKLAATNHQEGGLLPKHCLMILGCLHCNGGMLEIITLLVAQQPAKRSPAGKLSSCTGAATCSRAAGSVTSPATSATSPSASPCSACPDGSACTSAASPHTEAGSGLLHLGDIRRQDWSTERCTLSCCCDSLCSSDQCSQAKGLGSFCIHAQAPQPRTAASSSR